MFHWGLLGGSVALSLVTAAGVAPSANTSDLMPVSEIEIADISNIELLGNNLSGSAFYAAPLTIGQIGELRETAITFARVMDLLRQASVSSDGQQFGSQVSITALQLALILEHYSSEVVNQPTYQELYRAQAFGRQFIPDAVTELRLSPPDLAATPDGVPAADDIVLVSAPAGTTLGGATSDATTTELGAQATLMPVDNAPSDVNEELLEGELTEVLTEVAINGRIIRLDEVAWDDVAFAAVYLASLMSPDNLNAAVVSITLQELETMDLAGEEVEFNSPAELIANLIARFSATTEGYANGYLPSEILCEIPWATGHQVRCDAAGALIALNEAFLAEFGYNLPIGSTYRPFETQIQLALTKPHLAATPGTSFHGWGLAIDFGGNIFGGASVEYQWMLQNAPTYGWDNPLWARVDGRKPEPWHFEFMAGKSNNSNWQPNVQVTFPVADEAGGGEIVAVDPGWADSNQAATHNPAPAPEPAPVTPVPTDPPHPVPPTTPAPSPVPNPEVTPEPEPTEHPSVSETAPSPSETAPEAGSGNDHGGTAESPEQESHPETQAE